MYECIPLLSVDGSDRLRRLTVIAYEAIDLIQCESLRKVNEKVALGF